MAIFHLYSEYLEIMSLKEPSCPPSPVQPFHPRLTTILSSYAGYLTTTSKHPKHSQAARTFKIYLHCMEHWIFLIKMTFSAQIFRHSPNTRSTWTEHSSSYFYWKNLPSSSESTYDPHITFSTHTTNSASKKCNALKFLAHYLCASKTILTNPL